jgi:hypothetical protein
VNDLTQYRAAAPNMLPGDVIAFAGRAPLSFIIDGYTGSKLSHVAMVRKQLAWPQAAKQPSPAIWVTESTIFTDPVTKKKISGPQTHPLEQVLTVDYAAAGSCAWHLALADEVRAQIDWNKFYAFIAKCENGSVKYDIPGYFAYLWRSIPFIGAHVCQSETYRRMFCSAYDTAIFENSGVALHRDFSATSPADLVRMKLYKACTQIMGPTAVIDPEFNTL